VEHGNSQEGADAQNSQGPGGARTVHRLWARRLQITAVAIRGKPAQSRGQRRVGKLNCLGLTRPGHGRKAQGHGRGYRRASAQAGSWFGSRSDHGRWRTQGLRKFTGSLQRCSKTGRRGAGLSRMPHTSSIRFDGNKKTPLQLAPKPHTRPWNQLPHQGWRPSAVGRLKAQQRPPGQRWSATHHSLCHLLTLSHSPD